MSQIPAGTTRWAQVRFYQVRSHFLLLFSKLVNKWCTIKWNIDTLAPKKWTPSPKKHTHPPTHTHICAHRNISFIDTGITHTHSDTKDTRKVNCFWESWRMPMRPFWLCSVFGQIFKLALRGGWTWRMRDILGYHFYSFPQRYTPSSNLNINQLFRSTTYPNIIHTLTPEQNSLNQSTQGTRIDYFWNGRHLLARTGSRTPTPLATLRKFYMTKLRIKCHF